MGKLKEPTPYEILSIRKEYKLTQLQAGKIVGYSQRGWQEAELGRRAMPGAIWMLFKARVYSLTGQGKSAIKELNDGF